METYCFTFGECHIANGVKMQDYWVEVTASSYGNARYLFIEFFTIPYIGKGDAFAFQYKKEGFETHYFPKGCYCTITAGTENITDDIIKQLNKGS